MSKQAINWSIGGMVALSLGLLVWVEMNPKPGPPKLMFASPTAVRPWAENEWDAQMNPVVSGSAWKLPVYTKLKGVKELKDRVQIEIFETKDEEYVKAINVVQVDLLSPSSPLELEYISSAYVDGTTVINGHSHQADARFFNHQGVQLSDAQLDALDVSKYKRKPQLYERSYHWPHVKLKMNLKGHFSDPKWAAPAMFDHDTHVKLTSGMTWSTIGNITFGNAIHAWHDAKLICTLDLMHGPLLKSKVPIKKGGQMIIGDTQTTFIGSYQGDSGGGSGTSAGSMYFKIDRSKKDRCYVALEVRPVSEGDAFSYTAKTKSGDAVACHVSSSNHGIVMVLVHCSPSDLQELTAGYRPNRTRFIVPVGKIPGMPKENQGVKDLLDVTIPYFSSASGASSQKHMAIETAQLSRGGSRGHSKTGPTYYNMTLRELLEDYATRESIKLEIDDVNWKVDEVPVKP